MKETREVDGSGTMQDQQEEFEYTDDDRAFWRKEVMPQLSFTSSRSRLPWHLCTALSALLLLCLIIALAVSNARVQARLTRLEDNLSNISAALLKDRHKVESFQTDINKLTVSMQTTENQLVSVTNTLKAIDGLEALKTTVSELKCNIDKITKNITAEACCPLHWTFYSNSCYFFSRERKSWDSSRDYCSSLHSSLVILKDNAEWNFVTSKTKPMYYWIGLTDERTGEWEWVDGTTYVMDRRRWKPGQPDDWKNHGLGGGEDCAHLHDDGRLNDDHCSRPYFFVCKSSVARN